MANSHELLKPKIMNKRKVTVRWVLTKHKNQPFTFVVDSVVDSGPRIRYSTKRSLWRGTMRYMGDRPHTIVDETGVSYRGNKLKK